MSIKSYLISKELNFTDLSIMPIYLGSLDGRNYFSFAEDVNPPSGGKNITNDELALLRGSGLVFKQIKQKAEERILSVAPLWRQQNALVDLYLLGQKENPATDEQDQMAQAQAIITSIQEIRSRSNEIENSILNGIAVDYLIDLGWDQPDAE